jgi:hypothetical protein
VSFFRAEAAGKRSHLPVPAAGAPRHDYVPPGPGGDHAVGFEAGTDETFEQLLPPVGHETQLDEPVPDLPRALDHDDDLSDVRLVPSVRDRPDLEAMATRTVADGRGPTDLDPLTIGPQRLPVQHLRTGNQPLPQDLPVILREAAAAHVLVGDIKW